MEKAPVISSQVPRDLGLDKVVNTLLNSKEPLRALFAELGNWLHEDILIKAGWHEPAKGLISRVVEYRKMRAQNGDEPTLNDLASFLASGKDYLGAPAAALQGAFPFGEKRYFFVSGKMNAYNPSFTVVVYPEETVSMRDRSELTKRYEDSRFPNSYEQVKTMLFLHDGKFYLAAVPGEQRVNEFWLTDCIEKNNGKRHLGAGARLAISENPAEITGRERGCVSPFISWEKFDRISGVCVAKELLAGYSEPHYAFSIDKRSGLVVSDVSDLVNTLAKVKHYPKIMMFYNT